jgi:multidrug resistance efflux pump
MPNHLEIRSEEIHDIMQRTPKWITRWGISILLGIIILILFGTNFIHYPDVIEANVSVQGRPKLVSLKRNPLTNINKVLVKDKSLVKANDPLFLLSSQDGTGQLEIIKAPISGIFYRQHSEIEAHKLDLGIIMPQNQQHIIIGKLPVDGISKVEIGHKVILKLDAFPYREFGVIEGNVQSISPSIDDNTYDVEFGLLNGLTTQNGTVVSTPMKLKGKAEILTNDKSLLKRLFDII